MSDRTIITCPDCGEDFLEDYYPKHCCDQLEKRRKEDLRDRFAMAAIAGGNCNTDSWEGMAKLAYQLADAMLKAREEK